jgi:hypothetical protein
MEGAPQERENFRGRYTRESVSGRLQMLTGSALSRLHIHLDKAGYSNERIAQSVTGLPDEAVEGFVRSFAQAFSEVTLAGEAVDQHTTDETLAELDRASASLVKVVTDTFGSND